jgi:hypothetical protein
MRTREYGDGFESLGAMTIFDFADALGVLAPEFIRNVDQRIAQMRRQACSYEALKFKLQLPCHGSATKKLTRNHEVSQR